MGVNYAALGGFSTIVADPPWRYTKDPPEKYARTEGISAEHKYPTMTTEAISAIDVASLAAPTAYLYLWVTNPVMMQMRPTIMGRLSALEVVRAWGFEPKTVITWVKTTKTGALMRGGPGWYFRGATEHIIFAVRGKAGIVSEKRLPNVIMAERPTGHSRKPEEAYELVERVTPGPYLEMFARRPRTGWQVWGNEVRSDVSVVA